MHSSKTAPIKVAIVIPAFGQPGFLSEALSTSLSQKTNFLFAIIIVNDGCPHLETHECCLSFAYAYPDKIYYLRKRNDGLSAARNTGIEFALRAFPLLESVYFLDSDNRIGPATLQRLLDALQSGDECAGWAYTDIDKFGFAEFGDMSGSYSPLEHLFRNVTEAGSMAGRNMLDAGLRFDSDMRRGCEDWEFWLQGLDSGFRGIHVPNAGFRYRRRGESMLVAAERELASTLEYIRSKHSNLYNVPSILDREIRVRSRYAIFHPDTGKVSRLASPYERETIALEDYLILLLRSRERPEYGRSPGHLVVMEEQLLGALARRRMFSGILWTLERALRRSTLVTLTLEANVVSPPSIRWRDETNLQVPGGTVELPISAPPNIQVAAFEADQFLKSFREKSGFQGLHSQIRKPNAVHELTLEVPEALPFDHDASQAIETLGKKLTEAARRNHATTWRSAHLDRHRAGSSMPWQIYSGSSLPSVFPCMSPDKTRGCVAIVIEAGNSGELEAALRIRDSMDGTLSPHLIAIGNRFDCDIALKDHFDEFVLLPSLRGVEDTSVKHRNYSGTSVPHPGWWDAEAIITTLAAYRTVISLPNQLPSSLMGSLRHRGVETCCLLALGGEKHCSALEAANACIAFEQAYDKILVDHAETFQLCRALGIPERKLVFLPEVEQDGSSRTADPEQKDMEFLSP
ncbi:glycosyltransferase [Stappia sp. GBMRC 2046]|uniref:Glycosyltransferase n=1 Tax=Stappia sediminis TaxID=2692190 RepID=A0A7X3LS00_9HYPH|nr:glycosyltransferase [Stappia sediminis]MXN64027.1 glycosyltransferase [Stappia sediminis]